MSRAPIDAAHWAELMGRDLDCSACQPLQPVHVGNDRAVTISARSWRAMGFSASDRIELDAQDGRCVVQRGASGVVVEDKKPASLPVSKRFAELILAPGSAGAMLVRRNGGGAILPIRVREHRPDVLGPRFVDELGDDYIVRHAVPGPPAAGWTDEALAELEGLLCSRPFRRDPAAAIAEGNDYVAWMTRNRILNRPNAGDEQCRRHFVEDICRGQQADGSWGALPATCYCVLRLLGLGEDPFNRPIQRAARWLLALPEPPPRPGMWMLTTEYLDEWLSRRRPGQRRDFRPGTIQHTPPDDEINFFCWQFPDGEQDQFRGQPMQQVIPTCARHHPPACEPRMTHVSALAAETLIRCGFADHPRLRRYVNTVFHLGGEWGYWCGCGALGLYDADIPASESEPDFDVRGTADDGQCDLSAWRWVSGPAEFARLANQPDLPEKGTHPEPFCWYPAPQVEGAFLLIGSGWQNGDCWAKTNRALAAHPSCRGSLTERLAIYQASRYQTSLGQWEQAFPAGMLAFLALYDHPAARSLVIKTVPWLREHQGDDGLWHDELLPRKDWGKPANPAAPRLATYHIAAALRRFGLLDRLRPR